MQSKNPKYFLPRFADNFKDEASSVILIIVTILAIALAIYRTVENQRLKYDVLRLDNKVRKFSGELAGIPSLQVGDIAPSVEAENLQGEFRSLRYENSKRSLIFIFSAECRACEKQMPLWNKLSLEVNKLNYQVIGIAVNNPDTVRNELRKLEIKFEVIMPNDFAVQRAFRTVNLPLTVVTSSKGRIEWLSYGVLTNKDLQELSVFFKG